MNPIADGWNTWDRESSYTSDSDEELEHWQNRLHEVTTLGYNMMTQSLHCVPSEVWNLPTYDGLNDVDVFLDAFEREVLEKWAKAYGAKPQPEWVHLFCHTLDVIPMNWYLETDLHHGTGEWDILLEGFIMTFIFEDGFDCIHEVLQ